MILADVATLVSINERGGSRRHFLDGRPIHCGDGLELKLTDGTLMSVCYELDWYNNGERKPLLYFAVKVAGRSDDEGYPDSCVEIPSFATLRWPGGDER